MFFLIKKIFIFINDFYNLLLISHNWFINYSRPKDIVQTRNTEFHEYLLVCDSFSWLFNLCRYFILVLLLEKFNRADVFLIFYTILFLLLKNFFVLRITLIRWFLLIVFLLYLLGLNKIILNLLMDWFFRWLFFLLDILFNIVFLYIHLTFLIFINSIFYLLKFLFTWVNGLVIFFYFDKGDRFLFNLILFLWSFTFLLF